MIEEVVHGNRRIPLIILFYSRDCVRAFHKFKHIKRKHDGLRRLVGVVLLCKEPHVADRVLDNLQGCSHLLFGTKGCSATLSRMIL